MKSIKENLRELCVRLIIAGSVLFILSQLLMAFLAVFLFLPEKSILDSKTERLLLRIGMEVNENEQIQNYLIKHKSAVVDYNVTELQHGIEALFGMKNELFDVVCLDSLSATYLIKEGYAEPLSFIQNDDLEMANERLVLIGHNDSPEFLSQTKNLKLMLTGVKGKVQRVVAEKFLKMKLQDVSQWFSKVSISLSSNYALDRLKDKRIDLVLVRESDFKKRFSEEERTAYKVIWYSEPLPQKIVLSRKGLDPALLSFSQKLFKGKIDDERRWKLFAESLSTIINWNFRISGKEFEYNDKLIKEQIQ